MNVSEILSTNSSAALSITDFLLADRVSGKIDKDGMVVAAYKNRGLRMEILYLGIRRHS
jgi:hypothetical protein